MRRAALVALCALGACIPGPGASVFDPGGDLDGDGVLNADDCDASDPDVGAGVPGHADDDGDGFGTIDEVAACGAIVTDATDCDDGNAAINPYADEACGNAIDENCDGDASMCRWSGEETAGTADVRVTDPDLTEVTALGYALVDLNDTAIARRGVGLGGNALAVLAIDRDDGGGVVQTRFDVTLPIAAPAGTARIVGVGNVDRADGDPFDDLVVAVHAPSSTTVWVVRGPIRGDLNLDSSPVTAIARAVGARFGASVAPIGDVDGDDQDDFAIGAPGSANGVGCAWIVRGRADVTGGGEVSVGSIADEVCGDSDAAGFGEVVGGVGDVDADGRDDFAIAGGAADAVADQMAFQLVVFTDDGTPLVTYFQGPSVRHPIAFAGVGDVSGDGRDDLAVGMQWIDDSGPGEVVIVDHVAPVDGDYGAVVMTSAGWRNLQGPDSTYGTHIAALGDVQNDGQADFAVSAPGLAVGGSDRVGAVFVYDGAALAAEPLLGDPSEPLLDAGVFLARFGSDGNARFGSSLAGLGDVDADGWNDMAIGSNDGGDVFLGGTQ